MAVFWLSGVSDAEPLMPLEDLDSLAVGAVVKVESTGAVVGEGNASVVGVGCISCQSGVLTAVVKPTDIARKMTDEISHRTERRSGIILLGRGEFDGQRKSAFASGSIEPQA
jgi:hypothetical protein